MPALSDTRVLLTGDDEADLAVVWSRLSAPFEVAQGLSRAVSVMRLREFGTLVADLSSAQDALALLRASRRARPTVRSVVIMPADLDPSRDGWEFVERAAFALVQHPVDAAVLTGLIEEARRDYFAERSGAVRTLPISRMTRSERVLDSEEARWLLAERRLAAVLRRTVTRWSTRSRGGVEEALLRGVQAVAEATREAHGSPEVLLAIAQALGEGEEMNRDGEHEAA